MPNRGTHAIAGIGSAWLGGYLLVPKDISPADRPMFILGLTVGGWLGSGMPDLLDPPTSPGHRSYAHGMIAVGGLVVGRWMTWVNGCRSKAAALRAEADTCFIGAEAHHKRSVASCWIFLAGVLLGFGCGYGSHLALDAFTPKGLPLVG